MGNNMGKELKIIVVRETVWESIMSDAITFAMVVGIIGVGVYLNSAAMQWAGFLMLVLAALLRAGGRRDVMTRSEAIEFLTKMDGE